MGLFKKKADPLAQRAQTLNRRIAELEAEIARLSVSVTPGTARRPGSPEPASTSASAPAAPARPSGPPSSTPPAAPPPPPPPPQANEPVFERMPLRPVEPRGPQVSGEEAAELGLKRSSLSLGWRRLKSYFKDPPPSNEKLVNYLAAGGIQGLRPLRFERRIARNRIIFVCVVLGLLLWGLLVMFRHTH